MGLRRLRADRPGCQSRREDRPNQRTRCLRAAFSDNGKRTPYGGRRTQTPCEGLQSEAARPRYWQHFSLAPSRFQLDLLRFCNVLIMNKNPNLSAAPAGGIRLRKILAAMTSLLIVSLSLCQAAQTVTLAWNASSDSSIAGYKLRYGTTSGALNQVVDAGKMTTKTVSNLNDGTTYFFTVTAYNTAGIESAPSNQVSYTTNAPPSGGRVLTVMSGSGDGNYATGTKVPVSANAPPAGQQFDRWVRDYQILADPSSSTTTATMPSLDATIEATYKLRTISIWPSTAIPRVADGGPDKPVELGVSTCSTATVPR